MQDKSRSFAALRTTALTSLGMNSKASAREAAPRDIGDFAGDRTRYSRFWKSSTARLARLPAKFARNAEQAQEAERIKEAARDARGRFLSAHTGAVYDRLTQKRSRFIR